MAEEPSPAVDAADDAKALRRHPLDDLPALAFALAFLTLVIAHGFLRLLPASWRRDRPGTGHVSS